MMTCCTFVNSVINSIITKQNVFLIDILLITPSLHLFTVYTNYKVYAKDISYTKFHMIGFSLRLASLLRN